MKKINIFIILLLLFLLFVNNNNVYGQITRITNVMQSYGYIQVFGTGLKFVSQVNIQNNSMELYQQCQIVYRFSDNHFSCSFTGPDVLIYSTLEIILDLLPNISSNLATPETQVKSIFGYQFDGCQSPYFYDSVLKKCKKPKQNIYLYQCTTLLSGLKTSRISLSGDESSTICPVGFIFKEMDTIDVKNYRYINNQICLAVGNPSSYLQLSTDFPNITFSSYPKEFFNAMSKALCNNARNQTIIDLQKDNIYSYTCKNIYKIQNILPIYDSDCLGTPSDFQVLKIWEEGEMCINGFYNTETKKCDCNLGWSGLACDVYACLKNFIVDRSTNSCICNKTCRDDEFLDSKTCTCQCSYNNPIRCPDNSCATLIKGCNSLVSPCPADKPFLCFNGSCADSPMKCHNFNPKCDNFKCCWDGSISQTCTTMPGCIAPFSRKCPDGTCILPSAQCRANVTNLSCMLSCPDGVSCPPCDYNGCSILQPFKCSTGICSVNDTCNTLSPKLYLLQDVIAVLSKPIEENVSIYIGNATNINIKSTDGTQIGQIDLLVPFSEVFNYSMINVRPVSDSIIQGVKFIDPAFSYYTSIFSPVLNLTFSHTIDPTEKITENTFGFYVYIKFKTNLTLLAEALYGTNEFNSSEILASLCLGFINETLNEWSCVSSNNSTMDQLSFDNDTQMVVGATNHFTSFALLLKPDKNSETTTNDKKIYGDKLVMIITVVTIVSVVFIGCVLVVIFYSFKKYGSFTTMRKAWREKFKSKMSK